MTKTRVLCFVGVSVFETLWTLSIGLFAMWGIGLMFPSLHPGYAFDTVWGAFIVGLAVRVGGTNSCFGSSPND